VSKEAFDKIAEGLIDASEGRFECTSPAGSHLADDLVTEEIIDKACAAFWGHYRARPEQGGLVSPSLEAALRVVAPLIAARERDRCAQIAEMAEPIVAARGTTTDRNLTRLMAHKIAAAIRARGETP
jgi:hypothetical protein